MNTDIELLIREIENLPENEKSDPRVSLSKLREHCTSALSLISQSDYLSNEERSMQSTVWMLDSLLGSQLSFDRWLLFALRSKKTACTGLLRRYLDKNSMRVAA